MPPQLDLGGDLDREFSILGAATVRVSIYGPLVLFAETGEALVDEAGNPLEAEA